MARIIKNFDFYFGDVEIKFRNSSRFAIQFWFEFSDLRGLILNLAICGLHLNVIRYAYKRRRGFYLESANYFQVLIAILCGAEISFSYDEKTLIVEFAESKVEYWRWLTKTNYPEKDDIPF